MTFSPLEQSVLAEIRPTKEELDRMYALADRLIADIRGSGKADGMMVGSVARKTCVHGDRDLDVFMLFDPALPREDLEREGLALAWSIAQQYTDIIREKYAEHPYLNATIDGFDVDLVPCYQVKEATGIQSAVDRTPFHNRYISSRIGDFTDDVLLLKQFVKAGGVYGSDQMTEGFAGYLCELLVLHHGGFHNLLKAAAGWKPGMFIDIEQHAAKWFDEPLVVIDPVDPCRNVSASVSDTKLLEFIELCQGYLKSPSKWFFYRPPICILTEEEVSALLKGRESAFLAITLKTPPYIEDIVVPQLRKSLHTLVDLLKRHEFVVIRADTWMLEDRSMLLFELLVDTLPAVRFHAGPPVTAHVNAAKFIDKYIHSDIIFAGPFIRDGRYGVELPRRYRQASDLLSSNEVFGTALGKHVKHSMKDEFVVHSGLECWQPGFEPFISEFLQKSSPLVRIRRAEARTS
ncbi:CCA tRNA nucleotidyltransferase [Methanospirillum hungatei]|jgi:tRNA nucleotidyltransferase (CCA-adding enzyme)|uniref:CCA tRNA nucleotidyltransferase n=1 Tax=Methanospirillum hungatei TaxID=2203 RepID=UPI001B64F441|nr:CCA tRNA nucleotidyltransferase [Methanospirillum hungatei]MBP9008502.1 CCA tRNA nucleotidyltransferase [Methanospirillum sp.]HOW04645.1 CCA tRNA nucleotidyltransferase [Methanospirillum hungatei]